MKENDPVEKFIEEAANLLEIAKKNQSKPLGNITPEIEAQLDLLEQIADEFTKAQIDTFERLGIGSQELQKLVQRPENVTPPQLNKLERLKKLKEEVETIQDSLEKNYVKDQEVKKNQDKKGKSTPGRKKKFRPLGSKNDWKPM